MGYVKWESYNKGKPKISELVIILNEIKEQFGDMPVVTGYDGDWDCDIDIMVMEEAIIIGAS